MWVTEWQLTCTHTIKAEKLGNTGNGRGGSESGGMRLYSHLLPLMKPRINSHKTPDPPEIEKLNRIEEYPLALPSSKNTRPLNEGGERDTNTQKFA